MLALDLVFAEFERLDPDAAKLVKLHFYGGLSHQEEAEAPGLSRRTADRVQTLASPPDLEKLTLPDIFSMQLPPAARAKL